MRIWISGGGTGGHVYPALTVLEASGSESAEVTWLGRPNSLEQRIVERHGVPYRAVRAAPLVGTGPVALARALVEMALGTWCAWRAMGRASPAAVLVTGGYVGIPAAVAARLRQVPLAVFLPDVRPGKAVQVMARLADRIAVSTATALAEFPQDKAVVTGYPVRATIRSATRAESRARFGLGPDELSVLVFGGSQGARRLNRALVDCAERLLQKAALIHVTGTLDHAAVAAARSECPPDRRRRWRIFAYLHDQDMAAALAAADLVVSRAGAATLGEFPARGLPAILVPLPIAGGHQSDNAQVLVDAGAARAIDDRALTGDYLAREVLALLDNADRRRAMSRAARGLDRPGAARAVWDMVAAIAKRPGAEAAAT